MRHVHRTIGRTQGRWWRLYREGQRLRWCHFLTKVRGSLEQWTFRKRTVYEYMLRYGSQHGMELRGLSGLTNFYR